MSYTHQAPHLPSNRRYYGGKSSGPSSAPRPQPRSGPAPGQQDYGNYGGYGQGQQNYEGNYRDDGSGGHANNGYDGYNGASHEYHQHSTHDAYGTNGYHEYGGYDDGYGNDGYDNQNYSNEYAASQPNSTYSDMNGQYQQRLPPQQMRNGAAYAQPQTRGPPQQPRPQQRPVQQSGGQLQGNQLDYANAAPQRPGYGRSQSDGPRDRGRQPLPQDQQRSLAQPRDPRERSKPRNPTREHTSPDTLAWDNPFPTFPVKKKPLKDDADTIENKMAKTSLEQTRHSEDLPRPSAASLNRPRPSMDSADRPSNYPNDPRAPDTSRGGRSQVPQSNGVHGQIPPADTFFNRRPPPGRGQPPPIQTQDASRPYQQDPNRRYASPQETSSAVEPLMRSPVDRSMTSPLGAMPRLQQSQVSNHGQAASYHGPDSPSYVPRYQNFSPLQGGLSEQQARGPGSRPQQFAPQHTFGGHGRHDTIDDVYNGYYNARRPDAKNPPFQDREAEIEAEMPNFDDPIGERARPKAPSDPTAPISPPNHGRPGPDFYQQARAQRSQPDLRSQSRAAQRHNRAAESPDSMVDRGIGGAGSPPYQQNTNAYARPAYAALAQNRGPTPQIATAPSALPPRQAYTPLGRNMTSPVSPPQSSLSRNQTFQSQHSDPGPGYQVSPVDSAPYQRPATSQTGRPSLDQRPSNPDALPEHPSPAQQPPPASRPGLPHQVTGLPQNRPAPVRQYNRVNTAVPTATSQMSPQTPSTRSSNERRRSLPITPQELDRLRAATKANPSDQKLRLQFAKKLVEAAAVLSGEGGRADAKTRDKNRERYILDAHKEVKKLASQGFPDAQFYLADCYGQGALGLQVDTKEAFTLYQAAAKAGHAPSAYRTAVCCEMGPEDGGGTRKDPVKAVQWYKRAASLGDVPAMYKMGMVLLKGLLGQPANLGDALIWLKRAADRADEDNPHALHELGLLYESQLPGQDKIIRDERYAFELFARAAALRYKFSQFRLGQAYEYGLLTCPIDARQSIQWYTKAAAQAEHQSELALSGWYLTGTPGILEQSDTEAYLWARKAATADPLPLPKAMFAMGYFTEVGIGCPRSLEEAKRWYGRAAAYKFPKAQERLEELKRGGPKVQKNRERLSRSSKERNDAECVIM